MEGKATEAGVRYLICLLITLLFFRSIITQGKDATKSAQEQAYGIMEQSLMKPSYK